MSKYSDNCTQSIPYYSDFRVVLHTLLEGEGARCQATANSQQYVIDMDKLKESLSPGNKSVDIVFGCEGNKIQLVECKYRVKNAKKIEQDELDGKVSDTKTLLIAEECEGSFTNQCLILPSDRQVSRVKRCINDLYPNKVPAKQPFRVISTSDFINEYFSR